MTFVTTERSQAVFQPDRFCEWFAKALTAPGMNCRRVAFEADGRLSLHFSTDRGEAIVMLGPKEFANGGKSLSFPFGRDCESNGLWLDAANFAGKRILQVRKKFHVPLLDLFQLDEPEEVFIFNADLFMWRIGRFLIKGVTRFGGFVYAGVGFQGDFLKYSFEGSQGRVEFRLDMGAGRKGAFAGTIHLSLSLLADERDSVQRERYEFQVERYIGFLFSLCDPPCARYDFQPFTEAVVADSTQQWGGNLELQFFADPGYEMLANFNAVFGLKWGAALLWHGERDCANMGTYSPVPLKSFVESHMFARPGAGFGKRVYLTDLGEAESFMGGEERLKEALIKVGNQNDVRTLVVHDTCPVRVIGDDIRRCMEECGASVKSDMVYMDATAIDEGSPFDCIKQFWVSLLEKTARKDVEKKPGGVNIIGYGGSSFARRELRNLLERAGAVLNASLFPSLERVEAENFLAASLNAASPWNYTMTISRAIEDWSGIPLFVPPPPYGRKGTSSWLSAIMERLDGAKAEIPDMNAGQLSRFNMLKDLISGRRACFVILSTQARRLLNAGFFCGIPLVSFLAEIGFSISILYFDPDRVRKTRERIAPEAFEKNLKEAVGDSGKISLITFEDAGRLIPLLSEEDSGIVYSEILDDPRIRTAGKNQFTTMDIEPGFSGCLKTMERLLRLSGDRFNFRYGKFFDGKL